jgi:Holliday junction DNA helicase RuvA
MIGFLQGQVMETLADGVLLNVRGVGYDVSCSQNTLNELVGKTNVQLWIYTHVREDLFQLYGFAAKAEKELFLSLLQVSGIGPKVATRILSGAPLSYIVQMIESADVKGLSKLPKVGKKTAEQIVLDLRGKIGGVEMGPARMVFAARADIVSALVNLGFKVSDVEKTVDQMDAATDFEEGIKRGLSQLSNQV